MTTRAQLDKPAIVLCAAAGVVLAVVSVPFLPAVYCLSPSASAAACPEAPEGELFRFPATWTQAQGPSGMVTGQGNTARVNVTVDAVDQISSAAVVEVTRCEDTRNADLRQAEATIQWQLDRVVAGEATRLDGGAFTCAARLSKSVPLQPAPGIGSVSATSKANATTDLWGNATVAAQNETAQYRLTFTWDRRPPLQPPIGTPIDTDVQLEAKLRVDRWAAFLGEPERQEVAK
jgi:hypothetical protein